MKTIRGRGGQDQLWFVEGEIEAIVDSELRKAGLMSTQFSPAVKIEEFIERHLGAKLDQHAPLEANILGVTLFTRGGPPAIAINATLTGSAMDEDESPPGALGRFRATLAHEAGHVLLHRHLFDVAANTLSLFERENQPAVEKRCLKRDASFRRVSDWREFQANQAMAALLMPRSVFTAVAIEEIGKLFPGHDRVPEGREGAVAARLSVAFEVSRQAATIRLSTVGLLAGKQTSLL